MRIFTIILSLAFLSPFLGQAQVTKERELIGATGGAVQTGNLDVSYSVGETVIQTAISGSLTVTQGFQQSDQNATAIDDLEDLIVSYRIFPNPTPDKLTVEVDKEERVELGIFLTDMNGKMIPGLEHKFNTAAMEVVEWSLSDLPSAIYLLHFRGQGGSLLESHKIQVMR